MAKDFTYIAVSGMYFCCACKIVPLARNLLFNRKLHLESLGIGRQHVRGALKALLLARLVPGSKNTATLTLPVFGHIGMNVHRGYKIFDLQKMTATKIFDPEVDKALVSSEISTICKYSKLDFVPSVLEVEPSNRWYTEEYISGKLSKKSDMSEPLMLFRKTLADYLVKLILYGTHTETTVVRYRKQLCDMLNQAVKSSIAGSSIYSRLTEFINRTAEQLDEEADSIITLGHSHGDFSFVNFLFDEDNIFVIDWESARQRSILNDLYNYFFTEMYYVRTTSSIVDQINAAIPLFNKALLMHDANITSGLQELTDIYRWIYYLERIQVLLDREASSNQIEVIKRTMDIFDEYDSLARKQHGK